MTTGFVYSLISVNPSSSYSPSSQSSSRTNKNFEWRLQVNGLVQHPRNLSIQEMISMSRSTINSKLNCLPSPAAISGVLVPSENWTGGKLGFILEKAGVSKEAVKGALYAEDEFTRDLTVAAAGDKRVIVAYEKDGEPLPHKLRLVVLEMSGNKWIYSLIRIEVVDYDFKGRYKSRGFPDNSNLPQMQSDTLEIGPR